MRSIFVLLILVMIGLNGKGQSVTALPDSVLSQCCLEVTLLNGNVTTVDWVFVQYITRDGTGTKLFVEYAPNFGGIQWETQIRIQDDFDDVLERSKFIVIPFTVGSTDYGINRNWIANIEENTTTGGTWIYGRFGTPTKRKFSTVEDYETMKNLLLACRPRAIVVAENGLYTEGDTVRMGGFLIENTTITTEGFNWQMIDTLSSQQFGLTYDSPINGDTSAYFARRWGPWRQVMEMGQKRWMSEVRDTTGGDFSQVSHGFTNGSPIPYFIVESSNNAGTQYSQLILQKNFASWTMIDPFNSNYTMGFQMNSSTISIGANDANGPGNGPSMGAYAFGSTHYLYLKTDDVDNGTASVGQFLQLKNLGTGEVDFATIDLSAYLPIADTAAMLDPYIQGAGTTNNLVKFTGSRVVGNAAITENGSRVVMGLPTNFKSYTTAGMPTLSDLDIVENSTTGFLTRYKTGVSENLITSTGATNGQVSIFSSAGKTYGTNNLFWDNTLARLKIGSTSGTATLFVKNSAETESLVKVVADNQNPYLVRMYNNTFSTTTPVFEYFAFNTGEFRQGTLNADLGFTTNGYSNRRMIIKNNTGFVGIGVITSPSRLLHVEGEVRIADLTTDTPTRIVGADADGDLGALALSGLTISSGTLTATPNWLKTQMEAGNSVNINAGSTFLKVKQGTNNFWKIKNGDQFYQNAGDGLSIIPWNDTMTTRPTGSLVIGGYHLSGKASNFSTIVTQYGTAHSYTNTNLSYFNTLFGYDSHSDSTTWNSLFGAKNLSNKTSRVTIMGSGDTINSSFSGAFGYSHTINQPYRFQYGAGVNQFVRHFFYGKLMVGTDSTFYFNPDTDLLRLSAYGTPATTAAALSKTLTNYGVGFATDGTVTSREIKRDTTIYVVDADYDFSAALTTAQVTARHNRVIFLMTTTAAAGSDSELTLHTPDINLMQVEYLVRSTDEAGGFSNVIRFGTNNTVDSTNGLASSYFPAAGQGVGIRAGLRSGVYKYFYY